MSAGRRTPRTSLIATRIGTQFEMPCLFEGSCTAEVFTIWLERQLAPLLNDTPVVVRGKAACHKSRPTADLIQPTGAALLFLPPYSPDLNPSEHAFAALKKNRNYNAALSLDQIIKMYK